MTNRLRARFDALKRQRRAGLITYVMAGDPNFDAALDIMTGLPKAGADIIELGMPFSDPMADGPTIQRAGRRSLVRGGSLQKTLDALKAFRERDCATPVALMGYYNPIYVRGPARFAEDAAAAGADGVIIVDLPPEEAPELTEHLKARGVESIFLAAPTTDSRRLPTVLRQAGGFLYYVSIAGVTGAGSAEDATVKKAVAHLRAHTDLPIAIGFGIKTPEQAASMARLADAVVVGSSVVERIAKGANPDGSLKDGALEGVLSFVGDLAVGVRSARG